MQSILRRGPLFYIATAFFASTLVACGNSARNTDNNNNDGSGSPRVNELQFLAAPDTVRSGPSNEFMLVWDAGNESAECLASAEPENTNWSGTKSFKGTQTFSAPSTLGQISFTLSCAVGDTSPSVKVVMVDVQGITPGEGPEITDFTINPNSDVRPGTDINISWDSPTAEGCKGFSTDTDSDWHNKQLLNDGSELISINTPNNSLPVIFGIQCVNEEGKQSNELQKVEVITGPKVSFKFDGINSTNIVTVSSKDDVRPVIDWEITAIDGTDIDCSASGKDNGWKESFDRRFATSFNGTYQTPKLGVGGYLYSLTCSDRAAPDFTTTKTLTLIVDNAEVRYGEFDPKLTTIQKENEVTTATLVHDVDPSISCRPFSFEWEQWAESNGANTSTVELPTDKLGRRVLDASLFCFDDASGLPLQLTQALPINVTQNGQIRDVSPSTPIVTLSVSPSSVQEGGNITLAWNSEGANSCFVPESLANWNNPKSTSGEQVLAAVTNPGLQKYSLTCVNSAGDNARADVFVSVGNFRPAINNFRITTVENDTPIDSATAGDKVRLSWTTQNSSFCRSIDNGVPGWSDRVWRSNEGSPVTLTLPESERDTVYSFALECGLPDGQTTVAVQRIEVAGISNPNECGVPGVNQSSTLLSNNISPLMFTARYSGLLLDTPVGIVENGDNVIDGNIQDENFTRVTLPLSLLGIGHTYIDVYANDSLREIANKYDNPQIGFVMRDPNTILSLAVLGLDSIAVITSANDNEVVTRNAVTPFNPVQLSLLNFGENPLFYSSIPIGEGDFVGARYRLEGGLAALVKIRDFHGVCISGTPKAR